MKVRMAVEQQNVDCFLDMVIQKYHFAREDKEALRRVYEQIRTSMSPYASYRLNQRMRGVTVIDENQTALVAMTLGAGVDSLQDHYIRENALEEAYMLDCICNELLLNMYTEFNRTYPKFHRRYVKRYVFVGTDIPLTEMEKLLDEIKGSKKREESPAEKKNVQTEEMAEELCDKGEKIRQETARSQEIHANAYGVLSPAKSVVFFAVLSDDPSQTCEGICMNCNNVNCENRMQAGVQDSMKIEMKKNPAEERVENYNYGFQRIFGN